MDDKNTIFESLKTLYKGKYMNFNYIDAISRETGLEAWQAKNTIRLLEEGATLPFISRYRKEATGSLDEVSIAAIRDLYKKFADLDKRREAILRSVEEQGLLIPELKEKIDKASTLTELEDLYLPFRPKKRTRASVARERGLEPLADIMMKQDGRDLAAAAEDFLSAQVGSIDEALQGASQ